MLKYLSDSKPTRDGDTKEQTPPLNIKKYMKIQSNANTSKYKARILNCKKNNRKSNFSGEYVN